LSLGPELAERSAALAERARFVFPAAPMSLAPMGYGEGRAWWMIDMARLQAAQLGDRATAKKLAAETPEGLPKVRKMLLAARDLLSGAGLAVEFMPFRGGHTIPLAGIEKLAAFIEQRLPPR